MNLEDECLTCGEGIEEGECPGGRRPCGHHCNCSWVHDSCHWCGMQWEGDGVVTVPWIAALIGGTATAARTCRACGCTDERACPAGCCWVESDLCSRCA